MKIKIRRGTFETNSSSMHSLSVLCDEKNFIDTVEKAREEDPNFKLSKDGVLTIEDESDLEFGWGFEILTTFYNKLCYAIASICYVDVEHDFELKNMDFVLEAVQKIMPEIKEIKLPQTTYFEDEENLLRPSTGYIDHDSVGELNPSSVNDLADFLFRSRNIVFIDNDNSPHTEQVLHANCKTLNELNSFLENDFDPKLDDYVFSEEYEEENDFYL